MVHKHRWKGYVILGVLIIVFIALSFLFPGLKSFASPTYVRDFLLGLGNWGYLMFIVLLLATIPLPMPSTPVVLGGGYVYGLFLGTILALIACVIGGTIGFYLTRTYGKPLLEKLVAKKQIIHFNHIFKERGIIAAFVSYAIPLFPSDAVNLILGLTRIKYTTFILLVTIAHIPRYLIVNSLGEDLFAGFTWKTVMVIIGGAVFILVAIFREKLKKFLFKELREVEKQVEIAEKGVGL